MARERRRKDRHTEKNVDVKAKKDCTDTAIGQESQGLPATNRS